MDPKDEYHRLEAAYIAAINGIGRQRATLAEVKSLQQQMQFAQKRCAESGIDVEDVWTFVQRRRKESEAHVRAYAMDALLVKPLIASTLRRKISCIVALVSCIAALTLSQGTAALIWGIGGVVIAVLTEVTLSEIFPTPAVRIGREAARTRSHIDVSDLWANGSLDQHDYKIAYENQLRRMRRNGEI